MIECSILKQLKKRFIAVKKKERDWYEKMLAMVIRVSVILLAVWIVIQLENRKERKQHRKDEQEFLSGLIIDLESEIKELRNDSVRYQLIYVAYNYFNNNTEYHPDSLDSYSWTLNPGADLIPNKSRFESLKLSDEFGIIEDKVLRNQITGLYDELIAPLLSVSQHFSDNKTIRLQLLLKESLHSDKRSLSKLLHTTNGEDYLRYYGHIAKYVAETIYGGNN